MLLNRRHVLLSAGATIALPTFARATTPTSWQQLFDAHDPSRYWKTPQQTDSGTLAWCVAPIERARCAMYRATGSTKYLDLVAGDLLTIASNAYTVPQNPLPGPGWITSNYTWDHAAVPFTVHDGMICGAMADFCQTAFNLTQYAPQVQELLALLNVMKYRWNSFFQTNSAGWGCFTMPTWCNYSGVPHGWSLPLNMSNAWAEALTILNNISPDPTLLQMTAPIATTLTNVQTAETNGSTIWPYAADILTCDKGRYEGDANNATDTSHAGLDVGFAVTAGAPASLLQAMADTFKSNVIMNGVVMNYVDGTSATTNCVPTHWLRLTATDPEVGVVAAPVLVNAKLNLLSIAQACEMGVAYP